MIFPKISIRCRRHCRVSIEVLGALLALATLCATPAAAQTRIAEIRARGALSCAAFPRPGLAQASSGLFSDLCRAVAAAVIGPSAKAEFFALTPPTAAAKLRDGGLDLLFLTEDEAAGLAPLAQGPAVFYQDFGVLVEQGASVKKPEDLAGRPVCFLQGQPAISAFERRLKVKNLDFSRAPFEEDVEMLDAFNVRHCDAVVGEATDLANWRREKGILAFDSRLLAPPLKIFPISAFTLRPQDRDTRWEAAIAQIFAFLTRRDGASASADMPGLGLRPDWRKNLLAATGDYDAMFSKNLGQNSPFKLVRQNPPDLPAPADTLNGLFAYFDACLRDIPSQPGAQLTIAFSLRRDGALLGKPHVAFLRGSDSQGREAFLAAVAEKFAFCLPAPITDALGGAIAGRRLTVHFMTPGGGQRPI